MVIIMDMTSGTNEETEGVAAEAVVSAAVEAPYAEDVLLAGFTEVPAEWLRPERAVVPRVAEAAADRKAADPDAYMHSVYAAQGLPGRKG